MNEWAVFGVVVAMISAFLLVYTPLRNSAKSREEQAIKREQEKLKQEREAAAAREANTKAITELTTSLKFFIDHFTEVEESNHRSHEKIYERLEEKGKILAKHGEKIDEHERRLNALERRE